MRKNKYNNNGKGSSIKERKRGAELELMQRAGIISDLQTQDPYELIPAHYEVVNGKRKCIERACTYKADFVYYDVENKQLVVEDSKGFRTKDYIIKRKLMLHVHGIKIKET
jgi:hypothetical protein